jgi:hypothetical protein
MCFPSWVAHIKAAEISSVRVPAAEVKFGLDSSLSNLLRFVRVQHSYLVSRKARNFLAFTDPRRVESLQNEGIVARKQFEEMAGEGFRDVGILVFVFSLLDRIIDGKITRWWTLSAVLISAFFFLAGCYIERRRPNGE